MKHSARVEESTGRQILERLRKLCTNVFEKLFLTTGLNTKLC